MAVGSHSFPRWAGLHTCAALGALGGIVGIIASRSAVPSAPYVFVAFSAVLVLLRPGLPVAAKRCAQFVAALLVTLALAGFGARMGLLANQALLQGPIHYFLILSMLGAGSLFVDRHLVRDFWLGQACVFLASAASVLAMMGHAIGGFYPFYGESAKNAMGPWLVGGLLVVELGHFLTRPKRGIAGIVRSEGVAGVVSRRLLAMPFAVPLIMGWTNALAIRQHWYTAQLGGWIFSLANTIAFAGLIWWTSSLLRRIDDERERMRAAVSRSNAELEIRVEARTRELTALNLELQAKANELAESNAELEQFAYVAAHDLQEPLRNAHVYSELVSRRYKDRLDAEGQEFLGFIVAGAARMSKLISDLLSYSRAGQSDADSQEVPLEDVVAQAKENCGVAFREANASVRFNGLPVVRGNRAKLVQLFQNLLSNGVKYRAAADPAIEILARPEAGVWTIGVRDNGIGISPEYHERVFGLFKRLHGPEYPGTGVGLALCRRIVHQHGGRIWVESNAGAGTTIWLTLQAGKQRS